MPANCAAWRIPKTYGPRKIRDMTGRTRVQNVVDARAAAADEANEFREADDAARDGHILVQCKINLPALARASSGVSCKDRRNPR